MNDKNNKVVHPLIYPHPATGDPTLCVHCDPKYIKAFAKNYEARDGTAEEVYDKAQTDEIY